MRQTFLTKRLLKFLGLGLSSILALLGFYFVTDIFLRFSLAILPIIVATFFFSAVVSFLLGNALLILYFFWFSLSPTAALVLFIMTGLAAGLGYLNERNRQLRLEIQQQSSGENFSSKQILKDFREKLQKLQTVSFSLSTAETLDDLYRMAVELGRSSLGFDRLGIWLADADPNYMRGSFGTSETGELRDERHLRLPIQRENVINNVSDGTVWHNADLYNAQAQAVGAGWVAAASIWDGDKVIGWISTDNYLKQEVFQQSILDLLILYGFTLGHLAKRKQAEAALHASERNFKELAEAALEAIIIHRDGKILEVNQAFSQLFAYSREELLGQSLVNFFPPQPAQAVQEIISGTEVAGIEVQAQDRQARIFPVELFSRKSIHEGQAAQILSIRDLTSRELVEQQRLQLALASQKEKILREFLTTVSHDLKTPLSIINTNLYLLDKNHEPEQQKQRLQLIKGQSERLGKLIQDIITMSRLETLPEISTELLDINEIMQKIYQQFQEEATHRQLKLELDLDSQLSPIPASEEEIQRALLNLVENALHYTPEKGQVVLRSRNSDSHILLEVQDSGIGIDAADLPHIFEHFYRADKARSKDKGGTGLGLAIVKRIAEVHQGEIEVSSQTGQGSIFRLRLPKQQ